MWLSGKFIATKHSQCKQSKWGPINTDMWMMDMFNKYCHINFTTQRQRKHQIKRENVIVFLQVCSKLNQTTRSENKVFFLVITSYEFIIYRPSMLFNYRTVLIYLYTWYENNDKKHTVWQSKHLTDKLFFTLFPFVAEIEVFIKCDVY